MKCNLKHKAKLVRSCDLLCFDNNEARNFRVDDVTFDCWTQNLICDLDSYRPFWNTEETLAHWKITFSLSVSKGESVKWNLSTVCRTNVYKYLKNAKCSVHACKIIYIDATENGKEVSIVNTSLVNRSIVCILVYSSHLFGGSNCKSATRAMAIHSVFSTAKCLEVSVFKSIAINAEGNDWLNLTPRIYWANYSLSIFLANHVELLCKIWIIFICVSKVFLSWRFYNAIFCLEGVLSVRVYNFV